MKALPLRILRNSSLAISTLALAWLALACQPGGGTTNAGDGDQKMARFSFVRGKNQLLRLDSTDGRVWAVPESGDGGWIELTGTPDPAGEPNTPGRYRLFSIVDRMNIAPNQLLRVDRTTGRSWLREVPDGSSWIEIDSASESAKDEAPLPPAPQAEPQAQARPAPAHPDPERAKLPVVSRAVFDASAGTEEEKIQVVVEALQKQGLAVEIRVWAAKQLSVFDPEVAVPPLREALKNDQPEIVVAAIGSLQQLGDPTTIPAIQALRTHSDPSVQKAAREALGDGS